MNEVCLNQFEIGQIGYKIVRLGMYGICALIFATGIGITGKFGLG